MALNLRDDYPAQITPPPSLDLPATLVLDDKAPYTTAAPWVGSLASKQVQELRLRARRKDGSNEDEDEDADETSQTEDEDEESSTTADDEDRTSSAAEDEETSDGDGDEGEDEDEDRDPPPTKTLSDDLDSLTTFTVSLTPSSTTSNPEDTPLPSAFDNTPKSEFRGQGEDDSCPDFMESLLSSQTYLDCYPLSMMIQTSMSFFNARKQLASTVRVLDNSCGVDVDTCNDFMAEAATNLTREENCQAEFNRGHRTVMQAYRGLQTYQLIYSVSCLHDPDTDMYCYANAVTNLSTASDGFLYNLPYGDILPGSSTPTCNWCNEETMAIFNSAAANRDQDISDTYEDAARQVNAICGPGFVNDTLPEAVESMALTTIPTWVALAMTVSLATLISSAI